MIGNLFKGLVEGAAAPVAKVMVKKEETKQIEANLKAKLELSDQELAMLRTNKTSDSWRDEVVTVWVLAFVTFLTGMVFYEHSIEDILRVLENETVRWLLFGVVGAALGLKGLGRARGK